MIKARIVPDGMCGLLRVLEVVMEIMEPVTTPGQTVLPGMAEGLGYESIVLKPIEERFCWEYVHRSENGTRAYLVTHPKVKESTAQVESSKLLSKPIIKSRIASIKAEMMSRLMSSVVNYHRNVLDTDRMAYLDEMGRCKPLNELTDEQRSILEFEQVAKTDGVKTLLKIPSRHQTAVELAKIMGMNKDKVELTGKDGGAIEMNSQVTFYLPSNARDTA